MPDITVIIPTYSQLELLRRAIASLRRQDSAIDVQIVVVDNNSPTMINKRIVQDLRTTDRVVRLEKNEFYCGAVNRGAELSRSPFIAVLNDDAYVDSRWAASCMALFMRDSSIGSIASRVMNTRTGRIDSLGDGLTRSGLPFNRGWDEPFSSRHDGESDVFSAAGSCAIYRRHAFEEAGGFDERFVAYVDDIDLGFRLQLRGYRSVYSPACIAYHKGGGTYKPRFRANFLFQRNRIWNLWKNMPSSLLREAHYSHWFETLGPPPLMGGHSAVAWAAGWAGAVTGLPGIVQERRKVQEGAVVSVEYVSSILTNAAPNVCHL